MTSARLSTSKRDIIEVACLDVCVCVCVCIFMVRGVVHHVCVYVDMHFTVFHVNGMPSTTSLHMAA